MWIEDVLTWAEEIICSCLPLCSSHCLMSLCKLSVCSCCCLNSASCWRASIWQRTRQSFYRFSLEHLLKQLRLILFHKCFCVSATTAWTRRRRSSEGASSVEVCSPMGQSECVCVRSHSQAAGRKRRPVVLICLNWFYLILSDYLQSSR